MLGAWWLVVCNAMDLSGIIAHRLCDEMWAMDIKVGGIVIPMNTPHKYENV